VTEPCDPSCNAEWNPDTATRTVFHNVGGWTITVEPGDLPGDASVADVLAEVHNVTAEAAGMDPVTYVPALVDGPLAIEWTDAAGDDHLAPVEWEP
jgi:hypothetical protein